MSTRALERPTLAATMVQAVQDHGKVRRHRRKCRTQRLERTLAALASDRS